MAPPVLLLHGWGSSAALMEPLSGALAETFAVYTVDLPGHGHSPPPPEPWGVEEHLALLQQFITERIQVAHGTHPIPIIGHSNGGRLALFLAADAAGSALVDRLVLISPSGIPRRRSLSTRLRSGFARVLKAPFAYLPSPLHGPANDWLRHTLLWRALGSADYNQLEGVMRQTFVKTVNSYVDDRLDRIKAPTLLFYGAEDEAITRQQMAVLEEGLPDAGLVLLEGAGHYGYRDAPGPVIAGTRHFLQDYATAAASPAASG